MDKLTPRLAIIQSFIQDPPENDFQRGYFCATLDEAVHDINEAGSDIVAQAIKKFEPVGLHTRYWRIKRAKTLA